jgi:hypothetical protein
VNQVVKEIIAVIIYGGAFIVGIIDKYNIFEHIQKWFL